MRKHEWHGLALRVLKEDGEFVAEDMEADNTGLAIEMQLDECTSSADTAELRAAKLK